MRKKTCGNDLGLPVSRFLALDLPYSGCRVVSRRRPMFIQIALVFLQFKVLQNLLTSVKTQMNGVRFRIFSTAKLFQQDVKRFPFWAHGFALWLNVWPCIFELGHSLVLAFIFNVDFTKRFQLKTNLIHFWFNSWFQVENSWTAKAYARKIF